MLRLWLTNTAVPGPTAGHEGEAYAFDVGAILKEPEGACIAEYRAGQWRAGGSQYLYVDCVGPLYCSTGQERIDSRFGPFRQVRLVGGVFLCDGQPFARLLTGKGWVPQRGSDELWPRILVERCEPE